MSTAGCLMVTGCLTTEQQVSSFLAPLMVATQPVPPEHDDAEVEVEEVETDSQPAGRSNSLPVDLTK